MREAVKKNTASSPITSHSSGSRKKKLMVFYPEVSLRFQATNAKTSPKQTLPDGKTYQFYLSASYQLTVSSDGSHSTPSPSQPGKDSIFFYILLDRCPSGSSLRTMWRGDTTNCIWLLPNSQMFGLNFTHKHNPAELSQTETDTSPRWSSLHNST